MYKCIFIMHDVMFNSFEHMCRYLLKEECHIGAVLDEEAHVLPADLHGGGGGRLGPRLGFLRNYITGSDENTIYN